MRWLSLCLPFLPAVAAAQERTRAGEFRAMPPARIAAAMLPDGHLPIARVWFDMPEGPMPAIAPGMTVRKARFYTASAPVSADLCVQDEIAVDITPMPIDDAAWLEAEPRVLRETGRQRLYRYRLAGTVCDGAARHFTGYGMPAAEAIAAVRALAHAQHLADARPKRTLPFTIACSGFVVGRGGPCSTARGAMALFSPSDIVGVAIVEQPDAASRRRMRRPGQQLIEFYVPLVGMRSTRLRAILDRGRVVHVEIEQGEVIF